MSKRYAESDVDRQEIVHRHTSVANELFEVGEPIYVYRSHLSEQRGRGKPRHQIANRQLRESVAALPANPNSVCAADDDHYCVRALATRWKPDFFEVLVLNVSNELEYGISFVSPRTRNVYSPYDGGIDTFSTAPELLEEKFPYWQSTRHDRR